MINPNVDFLTNTVACWEVRICKLPWKIVGQLVLELLSPSMLQGLLGELEMEGGGARSAATLGLKMGSTPRLSLDL